MPQWGAAYVPQRARAHPFQKTPVTIAIEMAFLIQCTLLVGTIPPNRVVNQKGFYFFFYVSYPSYIPPTPIQVPQSVHFTKKELHMPSLLIGYMSLVLTPTVTRAPRTLHI